MIHAASGKQLSETKDLMKTLVKTCGPAPAAQSSAAESKDHSSHRSPDHTCDEPTLSPPGNAYPTSLSSTKQELR